MSPVRWFPTQGLTPRQATTLRPPQRGGNCDVGAKISVNVLGGSGGLFCISILSSSYASAADCTCRVLKRRSVWPSKAPPAVFGNQCPLWIAPALQGLI
jgi:hypothetical protein